MLSRITGNSIPQEARPATTSFNNNLTSFNLVRSIRIRRYKFLGHILRSGPDRLIYRAVAIKYETQERGSILMDAPAHSSLEDLTQQAMDKATWNSKIVMIPH